MGLFKESLNKEKYSFLLKFKYGFKITNGLRGEKSYTKIIHHSNESLWITVDPYNNKLYLYNEWECGGMIWDKELDIPQNVLGDENVFIDWLDSQT